MIVPLKIRAQDKDESDGDSGDDDNAGSADEHIIKHSNQMKYRERRKRRNDI